MATAWCFRSPRLMTPSRTPSLSALMRRSDFILFSARKRKELMAFNDGQKMCTTSGDPVDEVRAAQINERGQHKAYVVLCPDERAKGFVRPYRDSYRHIK